MVALGILRMPFPATLTVLSLVHALVDASCAMLVFALVHVYPLSSEKYLQMILMYNIAAFALQPLCGIISDALHAPRVCALLGILSSIGAIAALLYDPWLTLFLAGLGNALYHIGGGSVVLIKGGKTATSSGIFVAPGAAGLAVGAYFGSKGIPPLWLFTALLIVAGVLIAISETGVEEEFWKPVPARTKDHSWYALLSLLLLAVAMRSLIAFASGGAFRENGNPVLMLVVAAAIGKTLGGVVADRLGWRRTGTAALIACVLCITLERYHMGFALCAMALLQMTMPITLSAVYSIFPQRPGWTFGLCCLALVIGALPALTPAGHTLESPVVSVLGVTLCTIFFYKGVHPEVAAATSVIE